MIKKDTIVSTTDGRLTLLQWLKKVEAALKNASATAVKGVPQADGKVVFEIDFADGTSIKSDPFELPEKLPEGYAVDEAGNVTLNGGLLIDKLGNVEIGKNAAVDGTLTLNTPQNLIFKTGSINTNPEGYYVDDAGNVTIAGALTAIKNGTVEVNGKELYIDGRRVRIRSYKEGVWDNVDFEIQNTAGQYITVVRIRKNDIDGRQVRVMPGGSLSVDDELTANAVYIGGRSYRLQQSGTNNSNDIELQNQTPAGVFSSALKIVAKNDGSYSAFLHDTPIATKNDLIDLLMEVGNTYSKARYQHTVTIKFDSQNTAVLTFTAMSSNKLKVVSFQDLATVFGGRRLTCSGGDSSGSRFVYLDTHPSSTNDYIVGYFDTTGFRADETLGTLTGTGLTVEDDVIVP